MPALTLDETEKDLLTRELAGFLQSLPDDESRQRYAPLGEGITSGNVAEEQVPMLEGLLEVSLQSGHARKLHGAPGEQALISTYGRTPGGQAAAKSARELNRALAALAGHRLDKLSFTAKGPGAYSLVVDTDQAELTIAIRPDGLKVESVGLGL